MSLTLPPRLRGYSSAPRSSGIGSARTRAVILGFATALTGAYAGVTSTAANDLAAVSTVAVAMAVAAFAFAVVPEARSRPTRRPAVGHLQPSVRADHRLTAPTPSAVADNRDVDETQAADEADQADAPPAVEPAWLQALRSRVQTLESALEEQSAHLVRAQAQLEASNHREGDLVRVGLILKALRERVSGNPVGEGTLDRVEAAVSRLAPSSGLQRPILPTAAARGVAALLPPALPARPDAVPVAPPMVVPPQAATIPPPPVATTPAAPLPETPDPSAAAPPPPPVLPVPDERVLPVPAPPDQPVPRTGRWRRRGAA